jgi:hypothetical protein
MEKKSEEKDSKEEKINETLIRMDSIIKDINTIKEEYINFEKSLSYFFENNQDVLFLFWRMSKHLQI